MKNILNTIKQSANNTADIYIYGDIYDSWWSEESNSAISLKDKLIEMGDISEINLHINSLGGDVFEGLAMFNLLRQHKAKIKVYVDGVAASIASVLAMAGDCIYMPKNSMMMIHNCWTWECGNAKALRKTADDLDKIMEASIESYMSKINISRDELIELLDNETWLTAQECFEKGFCTEILPISDDIEQSASKSIMDLVQENKKLKMKIQEPNQITFTEETIEKIADKITERIISNKTKQELNKKVGKDSNNKNLFESFFSGIFKIESEEK